MDTKRGVTVWVRPAERGGSNEVSMVLMPSSEDGDKGGPLAMYIAIDLTPEEARQFAGELLAVADDAEGVNHESV